MRNFKITVNGKTYDVQVEELGSTATPVVAAPAVAAAPAPAPAAAPAAPVAETAPAEAAAPAVAPTEGSEEVASPMPGTIIDVKVSNGQAVKSGDVLVVLEAMKMMNEIKAPHDATVAAVLVNKGDSVDSGTPLVSLA